MPAPKGRREAEDEGSIPWPGFIAFGVPEQMCRSRAQPPPLPLRWVEVDHLTPATGRISTYYSTKDSPWPVRDASNSRGLDHVTEPNLETKTYNLHATCNQPVVRSAINAGDSYLFFVTEDPRPGKAERLVVSGYYTIDAYVRLPEGRFAIRTEHPHFVAPRDTVPVKRAWQLVFHAAAPRNKMYTKRKLGPEETNRLLGLLLAGRNQTPRYVAEIRRLSSL